MTNFRAHELMQLWLQTFIQEQVNGERPNFNWIQENMDAYKLIQKAIFQLKEGKIEE